MGQVLGVALSSMLTQALLARNLRARIVGDGAEEVRPAGFFSLRPAVK